jgi:hypothetical protein
MGRKTGFRFQQRQRRKFFVLRHRRQPRSGTYRASFSMGNGRTYARIKRLEREYDYLLPSSGKIMHAWNNHLTPPCVFMAWCLIKCRIQFVVFLGCDVENPRFGRPCCHHLRHTASQHRTRLESAWPWKPQISH